MVEKMKYYKDVDMGHGNDILIYKILDESKFAKIIYGTGRYKEDIGKNIESQLALSEMDGMHRVRELTSDEVKNLWLYEI